MNELKLYVWTEFRADYTGGLAVVIADSVEDAQSQIIATLDGYGIEDIPMVFSGAFLEIRDLHTKIAFSVSGGM